MIEYINEGEGKRREGGKEGREGGRREVRKGGREGRSTEEKGIT